jgi:pimeloyl-ACP methyl ester carboxylesterase
MHVLVNGVQLFFDIEGAKLVPDGPVMREKPTLLLLHGGPGFDHSIYKPAYSGLADIAQVIYLDHRGNGRSEDGPRESWNLVQWGDDVSAFCDALGISDPIVLGVSFGGKVALAYAPAIRTILQNSCSSAPRPPVAAIASAARSCSSGLAAPRSARWRADGFWSFRVTLTKPRSTPGGRWPWHSIPGSRETRTRRAVRSAARSAAVVRKTGRRSRQVQYVAGPASHPLSDARSRRQRRSDPPDREPGGYRSGTAAASGAVRTI